MLMFSVSSGRAIDGDRGGGGASGGGGAGGGGGGDARGGRPSLNRGPSSNNSMGSVTRGMSEVGGLRERERGGGRGATSVRTSE